MSGWIDRIVIIMHEPVGGRTNSSHDFEWMNGRMDDIFIHISTDKLLGGWNSHLYRRMSGWMDRIVNIMYEPVGGWTE